MGRLFTDTAGDFISMGSDLLFDSDDVWTVAAFVRFSVLGDGDQKAIISKYNGSGNRQFLLEASNPGGDLTVYFKNTLAITGQTLSTDTWYLIGVTNNGAKVCKLFTLLPDGSVLDNGVSGTSDDDIVQTADVRIGGRELGGNEMEGDIAHVIYLTKQWVLADFKNYLANPMVQAARSLPDTYFYLPFIGSSPEVDWSGNGRSGAVNGTPSVGPNPPVMSIPSIGIFETGGLAASIAASLPPISKSSRFRQLIHF